MGTATVDSWLDPSEGQLGALLTEDNGGQLS
jgi:hypothetical protein